MDSGIASATVKISHKVLPPPTSRLADALETLAEIASDCPEASMNLVRALRKGTANAFWGGMLQDMADRIEIIVAK